MVTWWLECDDSDETINSRTLLWSIRVAATNGRSGCVASNANMRAQPLPQKAALTVGVFSTVSFTGAVVHCWSLSKAMLDNRSKQHHLGTWAMQPSLQIDHNAEWPAGTLSDHSSQAMLLSWLHSCSVHFVNIWNKPPLSLIQPLY